jgi:hypothetical protein
LATNTTPATPATPAGTDITPVDGTVVDVATLQTGTLDALRAAFDKERAEHDSQTKAIESAVQARAVAAVWMSRIAYRTATHEAVATKRYPYNITGAAKVLGMPVGTLRPYALAGQALHVKDRAGLLSVPDADDVALVEGSFDATSRADQKAKRLVEKEKKAALEAKALELEALKAANGKAPVEAPKAPATGTSALLPEGAATGTDKAPEAPAGPSLQDDVKATAKLLVKQILALRATKEWSGVAKEVSAILADVYPSLKA